MNEPIKQPGLVVRSRTIPVTIGDIALKVDLTVPLHAAGIVLFAHGSGSSRLSPRNRYVAAELNKAGLATLLFDLLTLKEEELDMRSGELRFNIKFLADRLVAVTKWALKYGATKNLAYGYFGASTGSAAALAAAAELSSSIRAVVSRGGRPDLAEQWLSSVKAPVLLIVGSNDPEVIRLNEQAAHQLTVDKKLEIVAGASHLFEEPGALEAVAQLAKQWFLKQL